MKYLIFILAFTVSASAQLVNGTVENGTLVNANTSSGPSYLVNETFEGTGTPTGWSLFGSDADSTSPVLGGAQSLRSSTSLKFAEATSSLIGSVASLSVKFEFQVDAFTGDNYLVGIYNAGTSQISSSPLLLSDGRFTADFSTYSSAISTGTKYFCWAKFSVGGVAEWWVSTTDDRSMAPIHITSTWSGTISYVRLSSSGDVSFDNVKIAEADFQ